MLKKIIFAATLVVSNSVFADLNSCLSGSAIDNAQSFLSTKTISASTTTESWNEVHCANFNIYELAQGTSSTIDPSHIVGTWTADAGSTGSVTYNYGPGQSYTYVLKGNPSQNPTEFCLDGARDFLVTFSPTTTACP